MKYKFQASITRIQIGNTNAYARSHLRLELFPCFHCCQPDFVDATGGDGGKQRNEVGGRDCGDGWKSGVTARLCLTGGKGGGASIGGGRSGGGTNVAGGEDGGMTHRELLESKEVHPPVRNTGAPEAGSDREAGGVARVGSLRGGGAGLTAAQPERFESVSRGLSVVVTAAQPAFLKPAGFVSFVTPVSFSGAKTGAGTAATGFAILMP